jgi:hypothetical protein
MIDYKLWGLEEFGVTYLASAKCTKHSGGCDIGEASAGSDEVEHMFGVWWHFFANDMVNVAKMATDVDDSELWGEALSKTRDFFLGVANDEQLLKKVAREWCDTGHEITPNQAEALCRTAECRCRIELARLQGWEIEVNKYDEFDDIEENEEF